MRVNQYNCYEFLEIGHHCWMAAICDNSIEWEFATGFESIHWEAWILDDLNFQRYTSGQTPEGTFLKKNNWGKGTNTIIGRKKWFFVAKRINEGEPNSKGQISLYTKFHGSTINVVEMGSTLSKIEEHPFGKRVDSKPK